jgi:hypothetical protein
MPCAAVVTYETNPHMPADQHIRVARQELGQRLAGFVGCPFEGEFSHDREYGGPPYFIPGDTLHAQTAAMLGIKGEQDLFGGVVPASFVATKAITHSLVDSGAAAPEGWSHGLGASLTRATLTGFSAYSHEDARRAGLQLLERGDVRTKPALAFAGRDQTVVTSRAELDLVLDAMGEGAIAHGLVIEENLVEVETYSVGQVRVAGRVASYFGLQRMTTDNVGHPVYGGSDLLVASGDFEELLALDLSDQARLAVSHARAYDQATFYAYPGLFASRRNYDVVSGIDGSGSRRTGVLEQSWRMGGASAAELAALDAFRADPKLRSVHASSFEAYGGAEPPPGAIIYFHGIDDRIGPISRYATVVRHDRG